MGFFKNLFKEKIVKEISGAAWGHLVSQHGMDVDTLAQKIRCVERSGSLPGGKSVTFLRLFNVADVEKRGVQITGWETLDSYPDLVLFEGYVTLDNSKASLERRAN